MVPPYRFCLGSDNGTDACLIQGEANTAKLLNGTRAFRFFSKTVSQLPAATAANTGQVYWITDGKSASNCTLGGGSSRLLFISTGSIWQATSGETPGGSNLQIQINDSGGFGAINNQLAGYVMAGHGATAVATPTMQLKPAVDARDYGIFGNGAPHISASDIASNTQWLGCGTVNTFGTSVTWVSCATFYPALASYSISDLDCGNDVGRLFRGIAHKTAPRPR